LIELDGAPSAITIDAEKVSDICGRLGGEVIMAENEIAREKLWRQGEQYHQRFFASALPRSTRT